MTYAINFVENDALFGSLQTDGLTDWNSGLATEQQLDIWPQLPAQMLSRFDDGSTPRSIRQELGGPTTSQARGAASRELALDTLGAQKRDFQASIKASAPPMSRTKSSNSAYLSSNMSASPMNRLPASGTSTAGKRTHRQSESGQSASYTYGTGAWQQHDSSACDLPRPADLMLSPLDYLELNDSSEYPHLASSSSKRARVDGFNPAALHSYAYDHMVSPGTSVSNSLSSTTPFTFASEAMSRHSSVTSASVADALSMMRVNSACSDSLCFPFEADVSSRLCESVLSSTATEVPSSHNSGDTIITAYPPYDDVMSNVAQASVCSQQLFFDDVVFSSNAATIMAQNVVDEKVAVINPNFGADMLRSASEQSNSSSYSSSSSSAEAKPSERLQKHIRNGQRQILSKTCPTGPTSTAYKKDSKVRPLRPQEPGTKRKELITKQQPYIRPQHPKLPCGLCDEHPDGFRGEHELRRHYDRKHAQTRKVWICVDPHTQTAEGWRPVRPLEICKYCKQQKPYNVYYNAAAHLRRAHFFPRKRGRKARGEKPEKRAGKAGGDFPPINWLKQAGFLKEIEVGPAELAAAAAASASASIDDEDERYDEFECGLPGGEVEVEVEVQGDDSFAIDDFDPAALQYPATADFTGLLTPPEFDCGLQWLPLGEEVPTQAPAMEQTMSAPPVMMTTLNDYAGLYDSEEFGFVFDTRFRQ